MNEKEIADLRLLMEYEAGRVEPPAGFPALPLIPAGRYNSKAFFLLEQQAIWRKSWLLAGHLDEIPEPGCFRLWDNAGPQVVLVHTANGDTRAFLNTCRHRGAPVVTEQSGCRSRLTCRYHGWSYSLEGELLAIRNPEDFCDFDYSSHRLSELRCERFGRLIFVNFDPAASSLLEWLGPIAREWEEFQFDHCRLAARHIFELNCNWKIAMETNTEVYHVRSVHPKTVSPMLDDRRNVNTLYFNGHGRMVAPPRDDTGIRAAVNLPAGGNTIETVSEIGRSCTQSYNVFPNWVSPLNHRVLAPLLFWPRGRKRCRIETWTLAPDWGEKPRPDLWTEGDGKRLRQVLLEDTEIAERIQQSVESAGFPGVSLSYQEARIYHWHQAADQMIGIDNLPQDLRVAPVIGSEWIYPNDPRLALAAEAKPYAPE